MRIESGTIVEFLRSDLVDGKIVSRIDEGVIVNAIDGVGGLCEWDYIVKPDAPHAHLYTVMDCFVCPTGTPDFWPDRNAVTEEVFQ